MSSCYQNNKEMVSYLLENGADPNIKDNFGKLPIERTSDIDIIK
jgi:ankyrin repeat protein